VSLVAAIATPHVDWLSLSPALALLGASGVTLLGAVLVPVWFRHAFSATVTGAGFVTAGVLAAFVYDRSANPAALLVDSMTRDRWAALSQIVIAGSGAIAVLIAWGAKRRDHVGEYYALLAAAGGGMAFFVQAANLMTLFLGLEWFSIALYVLCSLDTNRAKSLEAGLKYLIIGSFGSAILLFGSALVYGATGQLGFHEIAASGRTHDPLLVVGLALILTGMAFKASVAPFHMWTPDVYEGAPTAVTAFMAAATKVAAFAVLYRILTTAFPANHQLWTIAIAALACISLAIGNLAALAQRDIKRMLAYSSVSHAGFMMIAIAANNALGGRALLYYLIPYAAMSLGAFGVVAARERELQSDVTIASIAGMGWERPFYGVAMWTFMLGAAGFPLTGGMLGKLYVFSAAYDRGWWWLVVVGVLATLVSLYYYLGVVRSMYMRPGLAGHDAQQGELRSVSAATGGSPPRDPALAVAVGASLAVTVGSFIFISPIVRLARHAASTLFS
jgi:NADH-quinone oxidoreductase subunit N